MRILNVVHYFLPKHVAGTEVLTYCLSKELKKRGHQVSLFFSEMDGSGKNLNIESGFYEDLDFRQIYNNYTHVKSFGDIFSNKHIDKHFANYLDELQPDVVHFHHMIGLSFGMLDECKKRDIPVVFSLHDYWFMCPQGQRFRNCKDICYNIDYNKCADCMGQQMSFSFNILKRLIKNLKRRPSQRDRNNKFNFLNNISLAKVVDGPKNYVFIEKGLCNMLSMHADSAITYKKIHIFPGDKLKFSLLVHPAVKDKIQGNFKFSILINNEKIFEKIMNVKELLHQLEEIDIIAEDYMSFKKIRSKEREFEINLNKFAGGKVNITFTVKGLNQKQYSNNGWQNLRIENHNMIADSLNNISELKEKTKRIHKYVVSLFSKFYRKKYINLIKKRNELAIQTLKKCNLVIAPTPFLFEEFKKLGLNNLIFSEDGIEDNFFINFKKNFNKDKIIFAFVGSIIPSKGVFELIKAFNQIKEKNVYLDVYGDVNVSTNYINQITDIIKNENISFKGTFLKTDIAKIYNKFDVLIVPSIWLENGPLVIRDAILAKTPVIASNVLGMNFLIKHNQNGLLFKVGDENDLLKQLNTIIKNPQLIQEMSKRMTKIKTIKENVEEHLNLYKTLNIADKYPKLTKFNYKCSIVIPTCNSGDLFKEVMEQISKQETDFAYETVVVDSSSTDNTVEVAKSYGAKVYIIDQKEFNHGLTRNYAISKTSGEIIILLTADAVPANEYWLKNIVKEYDDKMVAGVYCKQIPRKDCNLIVAKSLNNWLTGRDTKYASFLENSTTLEHASGWERYIMCNFDNVCSSIKRKAWEQVPFRKMNFAEDLSWGMDAVLSGHKIVYTPNAQVIHSHNRSMVYEYKRTYLAHQKIIQMFNFVAVPSFKKLVSFILWAWKRDLLFIFKLKNINIFQKIYYVYFILVFSIFTAIPQYKAAKDTPRGNLKIYKYI